MSDNLQLWNEVAKTDPRHTKTFNRYGKDMTAVSPMYLIKRATEKWGPMGEKWGVRIINDEFVTGAMLRDDKGSVLGNEILHKVQAEIFHPGGSVPCFGQTMFVAKTRNGLTTDEEAPKKSLTDALTKGLSWLGFAADVHMGLYDDSKYVNQLKDEFAKGFITPEQARTLTDCLMMLDDSDGKAMGRFLKWASAAVKRNVPCLEQLPSDLFDKAKKVLEDEAKKGAA